MYNNIHFSFSSHSFHLLNIQISIIIAYSYLLTYLSFVYLSYSFLFIFNNELFAFNNSIRSISITFLKDIIIKIKSSKNLTQTLKNIWLIACRQFSYFLKIESLSYSSAFVLFIGNTF